MLRIALVVLCLFCGAASAEVVYSKAELQRVRERAIPSIQSVMWQDIVPRLPEPYRTRAGTVRLVFPERGFGPMSFYASPQKQEIYLPLTSLRFFDDLATLHAWFMSRNCPIEYIQTYLAALFDPGQDMPSPLIAFGLDRDTLFADDVTYDLSGKIMSSGVQFLMAHELGHVLLAHQTGLGGADSQRQETEADAFALDHFARLGGNPMGVFWYYQAAWWQDPTNDAERRAGTHPVSAARIRAMAARLRNTPEAFSHGEYNPAREAPLVAELGVMIDGFADLIDDDAFLAQIAPNMFRLFPLSDLKQACPH